MTDLEVVKKMKQGMSYTIKEKVIIMNVFKYFHQEYPELRTTELVRRTSRATGCSEKSIYLFRKEEASDKGFKQPSKTKIRKNLNINSRDIKYDNEIRDNIRNIIHDLRSKNIIPSLNTILKNINIQKDMPKFSLMTLRRLLFDMGFFYEKNGNKCTLVENVNRKTDSSISESNKKLENLENNISMNIDNKQNRNNENMNSHNLLNKGEPIKPLGQEGVNYLRPICIEPQTVSAVHSKDFVMPEYITTPYHHNTWWMASHEYPGHSISKYHNDKKELI